MSKAISEVFDVEPYQQPTPQAPMVQGDEI
jgi:hypothetical protein